MASPNAAVALALAASGIFVFPCEPVTTATRKGKQPLYGFPWRKASTTNEAAIAAIWGRNPDALVGIDCGKSGLLVIDADRHQDSPDGVGYWQTLIAQHKPTYAPVVETPGGGMHFYFKGFTDPRRDKPHGNKEGLLKGKGVNARGHGGFVIAPGSVLPDGRHYQGRGDIRRAPDAPQWLRCLLDPPDEAKESELALAQRQGKETVESLTCPPPDVKKTPISLHVVPGVAEEKRLSAYVQSAVDGVLADLRNATKGHRNNTLNTCAFSLGTMVGAGWLARGQAEALLLAVAHDIGLERTESQNTVISGMSSGIAKPRDPLAPSDERLGVDVAKAERGRELAEAFIAAASVKGEPPSGIIIDTETPAGIHFVPFEMVKLSTRPRYLVKGVLPSRGLGVVWGPPKQGKSFWICDVAMHVAIGRDYRGCRVRGGPVIYCALEGQEGFEARAEAIRQHCLDGIPESVIPFFLQPVGMRLVKDHPKFVSAVRDAFGEVAPVLVIIDTLNRSFIGSESDDEAMTEYICAADQITRAFGCLTLIVHHSGHDASRARGHSSLLGALDCQIAVKTEADNTDRRVVTAEVEIMKDGPAGAIFHSELEPVTVGTDDDGDEITSCVVRETDPPVLGRGKDGKKEPEACRKFRIAVLEAQGAYAAPADVEPPHLLAVPLDLVREVFNRSWATGEERLSREEQRKRNAAWHRAETKLRGDSFAIEIMENMEWIWPL